MAEIEHTPYSAVNTDPENKVRMACDSCGAVRQCWDHESTGEMCCRSCNYDLVNSEPESMY